MLKGLDPLLSPDLIYALRAMGHGDELTIVDANYPASSSGPDVIRLDAISATAALDAILSVLPLDDFVPEACWVMNPVEKGAKEPRSSPNFAALSKNARDQNSNSRRWSVSSSTSKRAILSRSSRPASDGSMATSSSRRGSFGRTERADQAARSPLKAFFARQQGLAGRAASGQFCSVHFGART